MGRPGPRQLPRPQPGPQVSVRAPVQSSVSRGSGSLYTEGVWRAGTARSEDGSLTCPRGAYWTQSAHSVRSRSVCSRTSQASPPALQAVLLVMVPLPLRPQDARARVHRLGARAGMPSGQLLSPSAAAALVSTHSAWPAPQPAQSFPSIQPPRRSLLLCVAQVSSQPLPPPCTCPSP